MKMFMSDNNSGVHPKIMEAIARANSDHDHSYGSDHITIKAKAMISELLGKDLDVYFVSTGTAANIIGLSSLLKPYEAVICADTAHINVDECGALQRFSGSRIFSVKNRNGKIVKEDVEEFLASKGDEHQSQARIISISQTTETGTLYSIEEIKELADFAHDNDMLLHVDGARIANAVVAMGSSFKEMISDTGVDLLSFGGTKNGMMMGEAIVSLNKDLSKSLKFHRKQGMQLISKMRFVGAQFVEYLTDDLWRENALNANNMGRYLISELSKLTEITIEEGMHTNIIFLHMEKDLLIYLQERFDFYVLDEESGLVRLAASFDTSKEDIDKFVDAIKNRRK